MHKGWKNNITFVLVEPKEAGNIGASARALKNMGFGKLCLVNPLIQINDEARWFAHNAEDILDRASVSAVLAEAIGDKTLVVGTTRRKGKKRGAIYALDDAAPLIRRHAEQGRVALLFGREDRGLYNAEVEECGFLLTIPTSSEQPSLNLAQAVLLVSYAVSQAGCSAMPQEPAMPASPDLVDHATLAALYERISSALKLLDYIPQGDRDLEKQIMMNIRQYIGRTGITPWELNMLHGICSRIEKRFSETERAPRRRPPMRAVS